mmetsp:Transcript_28193/g.81681  ORF Transcript_28193/g.81681 Transcript_28193/m.81681 type:complete len:292 (-) Transcript_28193:5539-6414(-)
MQQVRLLGDERQDIVGGRARKARAKAHGASIGDQAPARAHGREDGDGASVQRQGADHGRQENEHVQTERQAVGAVDFDLRPTLQHRSREGAASEGFHKDDGVRREASEHQAEEHHRDGGSAGQLEAVAPCVRELEGLHFPELEQRRLRILAEGLEHRRRREEFEEAQLPDPLKGDFGHGEDAVERASIQEHQRRQQDEPHAEDCCHPELHSTRGVLEDHEQRLPLVAERHDQAGAHRKRSDVANRAPHEAVVEEQAVRRAHHAQGNGSEGGRVLDERQHQRHRSGHQRHCH